jgi:hypothetical protein
VCDAAVEVSVLGIKIGKSHHRHVIRSGIGYAQWKSVGERDGLAVLAGSREETLAEFEPFNQIAPLLFRRLEIAVFRVGKDEVKSQEPRLDVIEFVLPAIAEMGLANRFVNLARTEVVTRLRRVYLWAEAWPKANSFSTKRAFRLPLRAWQKSRNCRTVK